MRSSYLHDRNDFPDLLRILEEETGILAGLIEKDYWIMHVLHGLKQQGFSFELKGGTSLSKGYKIIDRFSEDIDIHIKAPAELKVNENPKNTKADTEARDTTSSLSSLVISRLTVSLPLNGIQLLMIPNITVVVEFVYTIGV